jgi:hypothetical protein
MTHALLKNDVCNPYGQLRTKGVSKESKIVAAKIEKIEAKQSEPVSLSHFRSLSHEIAEVGDSCSEANWDGYNAKPLRAAALYFAKRFIATLPYSVPPPRVEPEPIGYFAFIWEKKNGIVFSVTAAPDKLYYAALLGDKKINGQSPNNFQADETIVSILKKYFS